MFRKRAIKKNLITFLAAVKNAQAVVISKETLKKKKQFRF